MILTNTEREKFIKYLETCIESGKLIVEQMAKINIPSALIEHNKIEIAAMQIVVKKFNGEVIKSV